jgi:hypothetical protein
LQVPTPHAPPEQLGVPFATVHAFPHMPQCDVLVLVLVSQPFASIPSQLPKPVLHIEIVHVTPHAPQFVVVRMLVSQPDIVASQSS